MPARASSLEPSALFAGDAARAIAAVGDAELRQLRLFCVVVAAGGLSAATAELQADLSSVSRQLRELETRVGATLAKRGRGGFALTPAGRELHRIALRLLDSVQAFRDDLAKLVQVDGPVLRVGLVDALLTAPAPASTRAGGLPAALAACAEVLPGLALQLVALRPIEIERRILAGELDAGVLAAHAPAAGLQQTRLYAEPNSLWVAPGHPWFGRDDEDVTPEELARLGCVVDPFSVDLPAPLRALATGGLGRADSIEAAALLVLGRRHAAFLPDHYVAATATLAPLRRLRPALFSYEQDIVFTTRGGNADPALRTLLRALAAQDGLSPPRRAPRRSRA